MSDGKLRLWTNGVEIIIAPSPTVAMAMCARLHGYTDLEDYQKDTEETPASWALRTTDDGEPVEDEDELTLTDEDAGTKVTKTVGEWIAENGPGLLCGAW